MSERSPVDWALLPLKNFAKFSGRAPRAEFWWFYLATTIVGWFLDAVDKGIGPLGFLSGLFSLAMLVPWIAVTVRRFHDIDRTGWWLAILVLPFIFVGILAGANLFDAVGRGVTAPVAIAGVLFLIAFVTLFIFTVMPGTAGDNSYGPDPYGPDNLEEVFA